MTDVNLSATIQRAKFVAKFPKDFTSTTVAMAKALIVLHEKYVCATGGAPLQPEAGEPQDV